MKSVLMVLVLALVSQASLADIKSEFNSSREAIVARSELSAQQNLKLALAKMKLEVIGAQELGGFSCSDTRSSFHNCLGTWYKEMYLKLADGRTCLVTLSLSSDFSGMFRREVNGIAICVKANTEAPGFAMQSYLNDKTKLYDLYAQEDEKTSKKN